MSQQPESQVEPNFTIEQFQRPDGVDCYYFKANGITLKSSYDRWEINGFALGYAGREIEIVRIN
jgi:hypothetical protein